MSQTLGKHAFGSLQTLFNKIVKEDRENIEKRLTKATENTEAMMNLVVKRQLIKQREAFIKKLSNIGTAIGDCLRLAAKYKYPQNNDALRMLAERLASSEGRVQTPVVVQTAPQEGRSDASKGFWGGLWDYMQTSKMVSKIPREETPEKPVATQNKVIGEIRALSELRPVINNFTAQIFECYRRYEVFPNQDLVDRLHWVAEEELSKINILLVGALEWAARMEISETRILGMNLAVATAKVAEAETRRWEGKPPLPRGRGW